MSIKSLLTKEIEPRTETVKYKGETYVLTGAPNINVIGDAIMSPEAEAKKRAAHYTAVTKSPNPFSPKMVMNVLMVAATLQHEDDPNRRYDETEIAFVATRDAGLFLKLIEAATKVCGIADSVGAADTVAALGLGKPNAEDPSPSN